MWTLKDVNFLYANYKTMTYKEMAKALKRTQKSVTEKTLSLGLIKKYIEEPGKAKRLQEQRSQEWVSFNVKLRKMMHDPSMSIYDISEVTGKSIMWIVYRAYHRFKKSEDWPLIKKKISVARKRLYQEHDKEIKKEYYKKNREKIIYYNDVVQKQRMYKERDEMYKRMGWEKPKAYRAKIKDVTE